MLLSARTVYGVSYACITRGSSLRCPANFGRRLLQCAWKHSPMFRARVPRMIGKSMAAGKWVQPSPLQTSLGHSRFCKLRTCTRWGCEAGRGLGSYAKVGGLRSCQSCHDMLSDIEKQLACHVCAGSNNSSGPGRYRMPACQRACFCANEVEPTLSVLTRVPILCLVLHIIWRGERFHGGKAKSPGFQDAPQDEPPGTS